LYRKKPLVKNSVISDQIKTDFERDGAVVIRGLFNDWVNPLREGIEKNLATPGPFVRDYNDSGGGRFFGDYCNWDRIPEYHDFMFYSPAAGMAKTLMGSRTARLFHEHVLVKETRTTIPTPWHHDQPYYCVDGNQNCSLWLALDPVPRETALEFIAGSHKTGNWYRPERFDKTPLYENDAMEAMPDIEANRSNYNILGWEVEPGDVIAFHFLTLHGSPGNQSSHIRRRAFSSRWVGDDATFSVKQGKTSPPFPECRLKHGDPLNSAEFPLIIG
jgi:ectoine hydroxylase-related dioxygenase (phytanoyl-CoA dioxygenase family)